MTRAVFPIPHLAPLSSLSVTFFAEILKKLIQMIIEKVVVFAHYSLSIQRQKPLKSHPEGY